MKAICKTLNDLTPRQVYEIIKSRIEIFAIEQECIYQDCDDFDYGLHVFCEDDEGRVTAYLRMYEVDDAQMADFPVVGADGAAGTDGITAGGGSEKSGGQNACTGSTASTGGTACTGGTTCTGSTVRYKVREGLKTVQMGRVLTLEHGKGLGAEILREGIKAAREIMKADIIYI